MKTRLSTLGVVFILSALIVSGCGPSPAQPTKVPTATPTELAVEAPDPQVARDAALAYLLENYGEEAPAPGLTWVEEVTTPEGLVGSSTFQYTAEDWVVTVSFPVVAPEAVIYEVNVTNPVLALEWQGTVDAQGTVTETAVPAEGQPVVCWYGRVVSLSEGAQFDDYLALQPEGAGEIGVEGANAQIEGQIDALRDKEEPWNYAHFWGTVTCDVLDYGGCQLLVTRLRPEGPEGPFFEPDPVEGWEGTIVSNPPDAQFDDFFVLAGDFPVGLGIDSTDPELSEQLESLRDTGTTIRIWGQVTCPAIDSFGTHIVVTRMEVEGEVPAQDEYEGWKTYTNERYQYSLRYPADCTFGPMPGHCKEKPPEERPPECLCFLNAEDPDQVFLQAFTGEKEDLKGAEFAVSRLAFDPPPGTDLIEYIREKFPHYEEIPSEPNAKVGGIPAVRLYTPRSPMAYSCEEIFFIKDDKLFRIFMHDVDEKANRELYEGISSALEISVETG